jgi:hypothetical protein
MRIVRTVATEIAALRADASERFNAKSGQTTQDEVSAQTSDCLSHRLIHSD